MNDPSLPFLTVNGRAIGVEEALRHGLLAEGGSELLGELVDRELLRQYAAEHGISISDDELQAAADEMRRDRGLEAAERTMQWLRAHHQTLESVQNDLESLLLRNKIRNAITESAIAAFYRSHHHDLESITLFSIRVASREEAASALAEIATGGHFPAVAATRSLDQRTRSQGGLVGTVRRGDVSREIAAVIFAAAAGSLVGPVQTEMGWNIFLIASRHLPSLEEEGQTIRVLLFRELLGRLRASADIRYPLLRSV